jgi:DNA-binding transcriptional regulator YiaG
VTPDDLKAARTALGLTQHALARELRMGKSGWQSVNAWEKGHRAIPGPAQVAIQLMLKEIGK